MLKGSPFAKAVFENEKAIKIILKQVYQSAQTILSNHPLYDYFEKYIGGMLVIMDPSGQIISPTASDTLNHPQRVGYLHPLERENVYSSAVNKARKLLDRDIISSYEDESKEAGAIKIKEGVIFSFSGFEYLRLKERVKSDDYHDIFELINLYTLLTYGFFDPSKQLQKCPYHFSDYDTDSGEEYNTLREEIIFSLSNEELVEIATKIVDKKKEFNFGLLNEIFIAKVLLRTGFINQHFAEEIVKISNNKFASGSVF